MAEIIGTAVVQESVSQILSGLLQKYGKKQSSNAFRNLERLEMAHIRLEAVLQTSHKWDITDTSLLRWCRKLKSAAQECHVTLRKWKERILEDEHVEKEVSNFALHKRVVHATRSFVSSIFNNDNNYLTRSTVQRFEWFADGASEFLRLLELGGTPWCHMPFDHLIRHLLAGKILQHRIIRANKCPFFLLLSPFISEEHGIVGRLYFMQKDHNVPYDDFCLIVTIQLLESTDIAGMVIRCLQMFGPLFKSTIENIRMELMQLPTHDFSWVPYVDSQKNEYLHNLHILGTRLFRPNPLCCKNYDKHKVYHGSKLENSSGSPYVSLEPVIDISLQCQVSLSECQKERYLVPECKSYLHNYPYLKVRYQFAPHGCAEDMFVVDKFPATEAIYSEEQHCLDTDSMLGLLEEMLLPKAIDYFLQNEEATVYQMIWRSKHGTIYIQIERENFLTPSTQRTCHGAKRRKLSQGHDDELECPTNWIAHFLDIWATHAPTELQGLIMDWSQEVKERHEKQTAAV